MADLMEYKCPCCGGKVEFDSTTQQMKCPYCDAVFEIESLKSYDEELSIPQNDSAMEWQSAAGSQWQEDEQAGMNVYSCQSCGGEIVADLNTGASSCPYCDSPVIMKGQFSGELRPDYVIPFKLDKKAATEALSRHLEGKRLLPRVFKEQNHIDEIKGVYVPVWLFDADADAKIRYRGQKVRRWSDSQFNYTETSFYSIIRSGNIAFERVPVDGSTKMADDLMESIEPFNFSDAVDFQTAYLSGYLADKYDVSSEESISRANERIKKSTQTAFAQTVTGFSNVTAESTQISLTNGKAKYALYPVWLLNTSWNGNKYTFAMNGQTGKFVGNLPADKSIAVKWFAGVAAVGAAVTLAVTYIINML